MIPGHTRLVDATLWVAGVLGGCAVLAGVLQAQEFFVFPDQLYAVLCLGVALAFLVRLAIEARHGRVSPLAHRGTVELRHSPVLFFLMLLTLTGLLLGLIFMLGRFLLFGAF